MLARAVWFGSNLAFHFDKNQEHVDGWLISWFTLVEEEQKGGLMDTENLAKGRLEEILMICWGIYCHRNRVIFDVIEASP